jgi:hypothetical protein
MTTATVTITSDPEVATSPQVVSALVTLERSTSHEHVVAWLLSESSENPQDVQRRLKASHPDAIVSVVADDSEGSCSCWTELTAPEHRFSIAAAVAVVKSSWGWDESDSINVRINGKEIRVCAQYGGSAWMVTDV